jgi:beta-lactamase class A
MRALAVMFLLVSTSFAQTALQQAIRKIAAESPGSVAVACALPRSGINCDLDPHAHPPMQSVFKLPLAITVLHRVEQGRLSLDQSLRFRAGDRILPHTNSPLQDKYPAGEVGVPLRELLRLTLVFSDNVSADILLRAVGGPDIVNTYMKSLGVEGFHLMDGEQALHRDAQVQYRNWFEPAGAVQLLRLISEAPPLTPAHTQLLLGWMNGASVTTHRLNGELPPGTIVLHKTGTSQTDHGLTYATNDVGLIVLPDGRRLAIAVFVTDSTADLATRERVIARIARAAYDEACRSQK